MADTKEESSDSRTSVVGRKRDLEDSLQYRDTVGADDSSDVEISRKRVKETHVIARRGGDDLGLAINDYFHSLAQQSEVDADEVPVSKPSGEENNELQISQSTEQTAFDPLQRESGASQAELQSNVIPATWNQGVQSGLRTSFGRKSQSRRVTSSSLIRNGPEDNRQPTPPSAMQLDVPMQIGPFPGPLGETSRGSTDESGGLVSDWNGSKSNQPIQEGYVLALPAQTQLLRNEGKPAEREPQPHLSEPQSHPGYERLEEKSTTGSQEELHYQQDLGSSADDSEGEESLASDVIQSKSPSRRRASIAARPKKFEVLSNKAVKKLTVPERKAYEDALGAHQAEKREAKAIRNAKNALRNLPNNDKVKKLTKEQLDSLDPQKREEYLATYEADRLENQRKRLEEATCTVAEILSQGHRMPLPEHPEMAAKIAAGGTFYPRRGKPTYRNRFGDFKVSEILDQGKPIHIEQFSFNVFAPAFLAKNRDKWEVISQKTLVSAFQIYIGAFYSHVPGLAHWLRSTATARDALTVEEAKSRVHMRESGGSNISNGAFATTGGDERQFLNHSTATHLPLPSADLIEQIQKPITRDIAPDHPKSSNTSATIAFSDKNETKISATKFSGPGGVHHNGPSSASDTMKTSWNGDGRSMAVVVLAKAMDLTAASQSLPEEVESMDIDIDEAELFLQQKYFPSGTAAWSAPRCLSCGQVGHNSSTCPALSCSSCGTFGKHSTASCPFNLRCMKCRERGHSIDDCPEKLARSNIEEIACDMCGSMDHLEIACHHIWRSYQPKPEEINRVRAIPVHCYRCGASDHYGPECGLHRGRILSGGNTWSKSNLQKYLDPASQQRALSAGVDYSIPARSKRQFSIKGKANDSIPIDDSDDETFIRAKISPASQKGHIRFGHPNEDHPPRRPYENALARSHGPDIMLGDSREISYHPAQLNQQSIKYRPSGPQQGMLPLSMRGPNQRGRGKKGPNLKKGGPAEPGKKKRNRAAKSTKADQSRTQNEAKARKRG